MTRKNIITLTTVAYVALITLLSLMKVSAPEEMPNIVGIDKVVHFCFYLGLNTLLQATVIARRGATNRGWIIASTVAAICFSISIEFIQSHVGRAFELYDIVANATGAIVAAVAISRARVESFVKRFCL